MLVPGLDFDPSEFSKAFLAVIDRHSFEIITVSGHCEQFLVLQNKSACFFCGNTEMPIHCLIQAHDRNFFIQSIPILLRLH